MMTVKKYCEENNLDPNRVFDMVLGESGSILPKARGFTGYIAEIKDDCLDCNNDKFGVSHKEIPFSSFQSAEFGIGSGQLWLLWLTGSLLFFVRREKDGNPPPQN